MRKCELCNSVARMYCDSDRAILCRECDIKVHGANFLVAKHSRTLLCQSCQSLTPWIGSGLRLGPTISFCDKCILGRKNSSTIIGRNDEEEVENDDENDDEDNDEEDDEDDGDNQVVPLCLIHKQVIMGQEEHLEKRNRKIRSSSSSRC